jgi:hypothetical protein
MVNQNVFEIINKILASFSLLFIIMGTILNMLTVYICLRSKKLREVSTFKFLAITAINDTLSLYMWNQNQFSNAFFNLQLAFKNLFYCRFFNVFLQYFTLQFSSWLWVSISLDRFLSITTQKWTRIYFRGVRPLIYSALLAVILIGVNFNTIFTNGYSFSINGTEIVVCYATSQYDYSWFNIMAQVYQLYILMLIYIKLLS